MAGAAELPVDVPDELGAEDPDEPEEEDPDELEEESEPLPVAPEAALSEEDPDGALRESLR